MNAPAIKTQTASADSDLLIPIDAWQPIADIFGRAVDLDPCAHQSSMIETLIAERYYGMNPDAEPPSKYADGMLADWTGKNVWLFPDFADRWRKARGERPETWHPLSSWVLKAHVNAAAPVPANVIALLPAFTDRAWFHDYVARSTAFCLLRKRIAMLRPDRHETVNAGQPHMLVLWSRDAAIANRFVEAMNDRGLVIEPG